MAQIQLPAPTVGFFDNAGATEPTISSREIAELVESRHDNVKVTIERLVARGVITSPAMQEKATAGRPVVEYLVGKRDSYVIVAQLSPEFTARLVDRWQELKAGLLALPQDYPSALRRLASAAEQIQQQNRLITTIVPKAAAYEQMSGVTGSMPIRHSAKLIGLRPGAKGAGSIFQTLRSLDWIHKERKRGPWIASQPQVDKGYLVQKGRPVRDRDGNLVLREQCRITMLGVRELAKKLGLTFNSSLVTAADFGDDDDE